MVSVADRIARCLVTVGYAGLVPRAPGTAGTLAAALLDASLLVNSGSTTGVRTLLAIGTAGLGIALGGWAERHFGRKDPQEFVLDEVAGYFAAAALCGDRHGWLTLGLCFGLFRLADILKPFPVNRLQQLPRGWGIVIDDLAAGLLAGLVVRLICLVWI